MSTAPSPARPDLSGADAARVQRFRALLRVPTVSRADPADTDWPSFEKFAALLTELYPLLHGSLTREVVGGHSLLYRWSGSGGDRPTVLMAHYDVVPAETDGWRHPPFAADLDPGPLRRAVLHGRGTIDDKGALAATLEAVEDLVGEGFTPDSDVYLSFGHDEEVAGVGAEQVAALLASRGVSAALVLDEGGAIVEPGVIRGVDLPLAVVGVTEKGTATLELRVDEQGGHASTPPRLTATARLARAITRLTRSPFPARVDPAAEAFVRTVADGATGPQRLLFRHVRWTKPLVARLFAALSDETRALVRTTAAVTQLRGSAGANVLAERATATVNLRIAVGSSVADAVRHLRRAIRDPQVRIEVLHARNESIGVGTWLDGIEIYRQLLRRR